MIIDKIALPRRTFLRGMGVAFALPLLDAMVPALSAMAKTAARPVQRLGFIYIPNGANMPMWKPNAESPRLVLSQTLSPLSSVRDQITVLSGLDNRPAEAMGDGGGDHPRAPAAWLNATHPKKTQGADLEAGTTIDQIAATQFGRDTPFASLELALERSDLVNACGQTGYSCVYSDTIAWRTPTTPLPMENNPRNVFERLFGDGSSSAQRLAQMREDRSILDSITKELGGFRKTLPRADSQRVTEYFDAIREIERRLTQAEAQNAESPLPSVDRPIGIPDSFEEHCRLMYDLQVLAWQTDATRVITFLLGREVSQRTYPQIGVPDPHHAISHHQHNPERQTKVAKIDLHHVTLLAYFLEKLRATPDGDGSLLDHSMILYGGGISDGDSHSHKDLPLLLAGSGCGQLKGGRHLAYDGKPLGNLLNTLLAKAGVRADRIGDSDGVLDDLTDV
jgi:hypothetical protein